MTRQIFHDASIKLASLYLIVIMVISLFFSVVLFRVSSQELERSIRRPESPVEQLIIRRNKDLHGRLLEEQSDEITYAKERLQKNLFVINIFIFVAGGLLSYYLARRSLKPIEDAHDTQSRFTADASHELRTPITAMRAETELTLTEPKLSLKQAKSQLESNMEELDKLTSLSDGLLRLARIDENGIQLVKENLSDIIDAAVQKIKPLAEKKHQLIKKSKLPKTIINADKPSLVEAIATIIDNAVKYSPEKSHIIISNKITPKYAEIMIKDRGIGIKASEIPHIFDRFYRADQSRNKTAINGYGIGLSVAKATIKAHHGKITVTSTPSKGSTFTVQVPLS